MPGYDTEKKYSNPGTFRLDDVELNAELSVDYGDRWTSLTDDQKKEKISALRAQNDPKTPTFNRDITPELEDYVYKIAQREGIHYPTFRAMLRRESSFGDTPAPWRKENIDEKTGKPYRGVGQMGESEFETYKPRPNANIWDPYDNIEAAAKYYKKLTGDFGGDTFNAGLAYNQGASNVKAGKIGPEGMKYAEFLRKNIPLFTRSAQAVTTPDVEEPLVPEQGASGGFFPNLQSELGIKFKKGPEKVPFMGVGEFAGPEGELKSGDMYQWLKPVGTAIEAGKKSATTSSLDMVKRAHEATQTVRDLSRQSGIHPFMEVADWIDETLRPDVHKQNLEKLILEHNEDFKKAAKMLETGAPVDGVAEFVGDVVGGAPAGIAAFMTWYLTVPTNVKRRLEENAKLRAEGKPIPGAEKWYWVGLEEAGLRAAAGLAFNLMHYARPLAKIPGAMAIGAGQSAAGQMMQHGYDPAKMNSTEIVKEALALGLLQASGGIRGKGMSRERVRELGREAFPRTESPEFWARVAPGRAGKKIEARAEEAGGKDFVRIIPAERTEEFYLGGGERTSPENFMGALVDAEGTKIRDVYLTENEYNTLKGETEKPAKEAYRRNEQATQSILERQGLSDKYTGIATGSAPPPIRWVVEPGAKDITTGEPSSSVHLVAVDKDGNPIGRSFRVESPDLADRLAAVRAEAEHQGAFGQPNESAVAKEKAITEEAIKAARNQIKEAGIPTTRLEAYERKNLGIPPKPEEKVPGAPEKRVPRTEEEALEMAGEESERADIADIETAQKEIAAQAAQNPHTRDAVTADAHPIGKHYLETAVLKSKDDATRRDLMRVHMNGFRSLYEWMRKTWDSTIKDPERIDPKTGEPERWGSINNPSSPGWDLSAGDISRWIIETFSVPDPESPSERLWKYSSGTIDKYVNGAKFVLEHSQTKATEIKPTSTAKEKAGEKTDTQLRAPTRPAPNKNPSKYRKVFEDGGAVVPPGMKNERAVHTEKQYLQVLKDMNDRVMAAEKASVEAEKEGNNWAALTEEYKLKTQRALAYTGASVGLRSGDLENIPVGSVSKEQHKAADDLPGFHVMRMVEQKQTRAGAKDRGEGFVPGQYPAWLNQQAYDAIQSMLELRKVLFPEHIDKKTGQVKDSEPLFTWWDGTKLDNEQLNLLTRDTDAIVGRPELTAYAMRHGFTTELRRAGLSDSAVEYGTGHAAKTITNQYGQQVARDLYEAIHRKLRVNDKGLVGDTSASFRGGAKINAVGERDLVEPKFRGEKGKKKDELYTGRGRRAGPTKVAEGTDTGASGFGKGESEGLPGPSAFRPTTDRDEPGRTPTEEEPGRYYKEPTTPEEMRTSPLTSTHGGVLGKTEIVDWIRHKMEQVIRVGKQIRKASGHYEPDSGTIRTADAKNLSTVFHETGHAIYRHVFPEAFDPRLGLVEAAALQPWRDVLTNPQMMRSGTFQGYKRREYVQESIAEYFARYFTRPRTASGFYAEIGSPSAPVGSFERRMYEFHRWFDQRIHDNNPALWDRMQQLTELFNAFSSQSAYDRAMSNISFGERDEEYRGNFKEVAQSKWTAFMRKMVDTEWRVNQLRAKFFGEGGTFQRTRDDPVYALDAQRGAPGEALSWTGHTPDAHDAVPRGIDYKPIMVALDPFNRYTSEKGPIKNLYQITGMVPGHLQNDWQLWMVAQGVKERERVAAVGTPNRRGRKWNHPLDPETIQAVDQKWAGTPELQIFRNAAREFYRFREGMLEYLVQTGLLERSKLELFRELYPHYVPLQRSMYGKTGQPWEARVLRAKRVGGGLDVSSDIVKYTTFKGSDLDIIAPLESTIKDVFFYVSGGRRAYALGTIESMLRQMSDWGRYITPVQKDLKPVFVSQEGIVNLFRNSITWHEATTQHAETIREWIRQVRETVDSTELSTGTMPRDLTRGEAAMRDRITEALTARGWSPSEAEQMVLRMIDAGRRRPDETASSTERTTRITREVEKIVEKTTIMEKLKEALITPPPEGKTIFYQKNGKPSGPTVITVWKNGKPRYYEVTDRELFDVIKKPEMFADSELKGFLGYVSGAAKTLRVAATSHPTFWLRNPARDTVSAMVYNKYGFVMPWDVVKGVVTAMGFTKPAQEKMGMWRSAGGERAGLISLDRLGTKTMMDEYQRKTMAQFFKDQTMANPISWLKIPLEMSRRISEKFETGTRIAVFETAVRHLQRKRFSEEDAIRMAIHQSRDTTLDYNRAGLYARQINAFTAFYNAQVRDFEKIIREFSAEKTPDGWKMKNPMAFAKALMFVTAPSIINAILNYDDPVYTNQKWYVKDFFWYFSPPGRRTAMLEYATKYGKTPQNWDAKQWAEFNRDHPMWVFPKPFTLGVIFGSLPERMMAHAMRQLDQEGSNAGDNILRTAGKFFTAAASGEAMDGYLKSFASSMPGEYGIPTPTGLVPILEGAVNKNFWAWRPIIPESKKDGPNIMQYAPYTSETAKKMARVFDVIIGGKLGGSREAGKGAIETVLPLNSPAMLEHYLQGYFAQWGKDFLRAMDGTEKLLIQDPFIRSVEKREGRSWNELKPAEKARYADEFQRQMRGHWQLRVPPDPTKSDMWLIGSFIPRFPSANTEAMERMFENINTNRALKQVYENRLINREWTPWITKYELEQMEKDAQLFRLGMANDETITRMTSRIGQMMSVIDGLTTSPVIDLTPAERRKYIDIIYMALNQVAVRYNQMTDDARKAEQNKKKKEAAYP